MPRVCRSALCRLRPGRHTIFRQFRRWADSGVWDVILEGLAGSGVSDAALQMIDATIIRAHHCAAGGKGGPSATRSVVRVAATTPLFFNDVRWAEGQYNRLPSLAGELVSRSVAVIVAFDAPAAFAAKAATKTIPIVFGTGADPVNTGLVDSFSRPGGNLTGVTALTSILGPKRLELLRELLPSTGTIALLVNPNNPNARADVPEIEAAANAIGRHLEVLTATTERDLEAAFTTMVERQAGALVVMPDPLFFARREQLVALAARYAVQLFIRPGVCQNGGLMSYGSNLPDAYRQMGIHTGKILKGAKPADLPVMQSSENRAGDQPQDRQTLGLTFPITLLGRADEVIE